MTEQTTTEQQPAAPDPAAVRAAITRKTVLSALVDAMKAELAEANTDVQYLLDQQARATGSTKFDAALPDGVKVGSISLVGGEATAQVTDPAAYIAWARAAYPSEATTVIVKDVRASFTAALLAQMTAAGIAQYADPETGEVHDVPGVAIRPSRARTNRLTFARATKARAAGRDLVAAAWRDGQLADLVMPALAPAPDAE